MATRRGSWGWGEGIPILTKDVSSSILNIPLVDINCLNSFSLWERETLTKVGLEPCIEDRGGVYLRASVQFLQRQKLHEMAAIASSTWSSHTEPSLPRRAIGLPVTHLCRRRKLIPKRVLMQGFFFFNFLLIFCDFHIMHPNPLISSSLHICPLPFHPPFPKQKKTKQSKNLSMEVAAYLTVYCFP